MSELIKKIIKKLYPELDSGLHMSKYAKVVRVAKPPASGDVSSADEPYYAVDIRMLTEKGEIDESKPVYESVPIDLPMASAFQGFFGFPKSGAVVVVQFAYGSPEHPFISNILPHDLALPNVPEGDLLWQQTEKTFIRAKKEGTWQQQADKNVNVTAGKEITHRAEKFSIGNGSVELLHEIISFLDQTSQHTHPTPHGTSSAPNQAAEFNAIKAKVKQLTK